MHQRENNEGEFTQSDSRMDIVAVESRLGEAIDDIRRQIAIDLPKANTVVEAYQNLNLATNRQIRIIEESVGSVSEKVKF